MKKSAGVWALCVVLIVLSGTQADSQVNVITQHNDNWRTGQNTNEVHLTTGISGNVNKSTFGLLCKISVNGQVYGQPLVVADGSGGGMTVYIATMQDYLYAFHVPPNLTSTNCPTALPPTPLNLLPSGEFPADCCYIGNGVGKANACSDIPRAISPSVGVLGTPVIDVGSNILYLIAESQLGNTDPEGQNCQNKTLPTAWYHRLHALDLSSSNFLNEKPNSPTPPILPSQIGSAIFSSQKLLQRPGLLFLGPAISPTSPTVYVGFSMMDGTTPNPSGWILAYDGGNLGLGGFPLAYATTAGMGDPHNRHGGGAWMGGGGLPAGLDENSNNFIYLTTADGQFDNPLAGQRRQQLSQTDHRLAGLQLFRSFGPVLPLGHQLRHKGHGFGLGRRRLNSRWHSYERCPPRRQRGQGGSHLGGGSHQPGRVRWPCHSRLRPIQD